MELAMGWVMPPKKYWMAQHIAKTVAYSTDTLQLRTKMEADGRITAWGEVRG